jgi:hypothetical protein
LLTSNDQINANIIIQHEAQDVIHANRAATDDLPLQILTNQEDLRRIVQYQNAGQHVAECVQIRDDIKKLVCTSPEFALVLGEYGLYFPHNSPHNSQ